MHNNTLQTMQGVDENGKPKSLMVEANGGLAVNVQDQTTPSIIVKFNKVTNQTTLASNSTIDTKALVVTSATGISIGSYLLLFNAAAVRFMPAEVTGVAGVNITIDRPLDFSFPSGTFVDVAVTNMNVDGSGTPQVFGLRGTGTPPGVDLDVDITRIILSCICTTAVDLSLFANITKLTNGLLCRRRDGTYRNIFNVKNNREIAGIQYDFTPYAALNPVQGVDGFVARLTFGGQNKIGVVQRLALGEDLELIVQDNQAVGTPNITILEGIAEGHLVQN